MPDHRPLLALLIALLVSACGGERGKPAPASPGLAADATAQAVAFPSPASAEFCLAAQRFMANTAVEAKNTVFTDMPSYRHSKPSPNPLLIYQVVTYAGKLPIMVSCKLKTAAHLRAVYGPQAAGDQRFCPAVTRELLATAVGALRQDNDAAAAERAAAFVLDEDEPYMTGRDYLAEFPLSSRGADGAVHISSHGLFQNYDSWITALLPRQVQGQSYCHLATVEYLTALARGEIEPGTVVTTADDAPVVPAGG
jgi:hypothetical protein